MYAARAWSVRHARGLNAFYRGFEALLVGMHGIFRTLGYERIERPVAGIENPAGCHPSRPVPVASCISASETWRP